MPVGQKDLLVPKFLRAQTAVAQSMVVYAHEGTKSFCLVLAWSNFWIFCHVKHHWADTNLQCLVHGMCAAKILFKLVWLFQLNYGFIRHFNFLV